MFFKTTNALHVAKLIQIALLAILVKIVLVVKQGLFCQMEIAYLVLKIHQIVQPVRATLN